MLSDPVTPEYGADTAELKPSAEPVAERQRIVSLDIIRGVAVLGILYMNIQSFSMVSAAYNNPTAYGQLSGLEFAIWFLGHLFFELKFMSIFSMLFGAGVVLMATRASASSGTPVRIHYRRMAVLLVFGALHGYLLWSGDILFHYAVCGMAIYPLRKASPRVLISLGVALICIGGFITVGLGLKQQNRDARAHRAMEYEFAPPDWLIEREHEAFRSSWSTQMKWRTRHTFSLQFIAFPVWFFWRISGLMVLGMGLYKTGVFSASCSPAFYLRLLTGGIFVALPFVVYGTWLNFHVNWDVDYSAYFGTLYNYTASPLVALGWVSAVMLACQRYANDELHGREGFSNPFLNALLCTPFLGRLEAVGRMALSNYITHTLICTTLFYGHGFGLYGAVSRPVQVLIVLSIWTFQLLLSPVWLYYYRFGPLEWLWRTLTYFQVQPIRVKPLPATLSQEVRNH